MLSSETEISQLRQTYSQEYQELPKIRKQIVRLYSVIYEPVSRSKFLKCLDSLGEKNKHNKAFVSATLKPHLEYLLDRELLVQELGKSPQCNPLIAEIATRDAIQAEVWEDMVKIAQTHLPIQTRYNSKDTRVFNSVEQLIREVRIGIYRQDIEFVWRQLECYQKYSYYPEPIQLDDILNLLLNNPFDPDWFSHLPQQLYELGLASILLNSVIYLSPAKSAFTLLQAEGNKPDGRCSDPLRLLLAEQLILRDDIAAAKINLEQVSPQNQEPANVFWGWLAFIEGDNEQAIDFYTSAYKSLRKSTKKKKIFFDSIGGIFFILALLKDGTSVRLKEAEGYCKIMATANSWLSYTYVWLLKLLQIQQGDMSQKEWIYENGIDSYEESHSIETFFCSLCLYWVDEKEAKRRVPRLLKFLGDRAEAVGYYWLGVEAAELLFRLKTKKSLVAEINGNTEAPSLVDLIKPKQPWELSLKALANLQKPEIEVKVESAKASGMVVNLLYQQLCAATSRTKN